MQGKITFYCHTDTVGRVLSRFEMFFQPLFKGILESLNIVCKEQIDFFLRRFSVIKNVL